MANKSNYSTTNSIYGQGWETAGPFPASFTQSAPYRALTNKRTFLTDQIPKDRTSIAQVHDPDRPCGIMGISNVPTNTPLGEVKGEFTNIHQDFSSDRQGLWSNAMHNTDGATIDRQGQGTYSNLQGAWSRLGTSTYAAVHGTGEWVPRWRTMSNQAPHLTELYDHRNYNPRDVVIDIEDVPQNMEHKIQPAI